MSEVLERRRFREEMATIVKRDLVIVLSNPEKPSLSSPEKPPTKLDLKRDELTKDIEIGMEIGYIAKRYGSTHSYIRSWIKSRLGTEFFNAHSINLYNRCNNRKDYWNE
jgi:hypothetical protein